MMYKPTEASQLLHIPESTLRRLAKQFETYLSAQPGRKRRYTERDISILSQARELLARGYTVSMARGELDKTVELLEPEPPAPEAEPEPGGSPVMRQLAVMDKQYTSMLSELERLRAEHAEDRERLSRLEAYLALPFWKRLFTSAPKKGARR